MAGHGAAMGAKRLPPFLVDRGRRVQAVRHAVAQAVAECRGGAEQARRTLDQLSPGLLPPLRSSGSPLRHPAPSTTRP